MKSFNFILFLAVCATIGFFGSKAIMTWRTQSQKDHDFTRVLGNEVKTGTGDAPGFRGFTLAAPVADPVALADQWSHLFATTVGIEYSPAWTVEALTAQTKAAHQKGLTVMLLPPRKFSAANPYASPLAQIAADAQSAKVDRLCISWLDSAPDDAAWRNRSAAVKAIFHGSIIMATSADVFPGVTCWDAADAIAVIGPITLPRRLPHSSADMSLEDFRVAWNCRLTEFEDIGIANQKQVFLLNMDVPVAVSTRLTIPGEAELKPADNPTLQSIDYQALLTETKGRATWMNPQTGEEMKRDYYINGLLLTWAAKSPDAANNVPGLLPKITEFWDPKKPRETPPPDMVDPGAVDPVDPGPPDPAPVTATGGGGPG